MPIEFSDDVDPASRDPKEVLGVPEQRVHAEFVVLKSPCFRFWLTPEEFKGTTSFNTDVCWSLRDGNIGIWMTLADVELLRKNGEMTIVNFLAERTIDDHVV